MEKRNLAVSKCTYIIITGATAKQLEQNINDIIAQGWNAERFIGGPVKDDSGFHQAILVCPGSVDSDYKSKDSASV